MPEGGYFSNYFTVLLPAVWGAMQQLEDGMFGGKYLASICAKIK